MGEESQQIVEGGTLDIPDEQPSDTPEHAKPYSPDSTPPDGALVAWLHVAGSFFLFFNSWGIMNAFGVFQTFYDTGDPFRVFFGHLLDRLYPSIATAAGWYRRWPCLRSRVYALAAQLRHVRRGVRSYDAEHMSRVLAGHSCARFLCRCWIWLSLCSVCFDSSDILRSRLGLAVGVAAAGSSLGGVIYPIVLYQLLGQVGFGWTVRIITFIALGTLLVPIAALKQRIKPHKARAFIDWSAFVDVHYMVFVLGLLIGLMGLLVLFFYVSFYATAQHITTTKPFYMVPNLNAASCLGRTAPNIISDITGPFNLIAPGTFIVGILILCMNAVDSVAGEIIIAILSGFFSGVFIGMPPLCLIALTEDKSKIGTRMGMGYGMIGLGVLAGGPAGGAILGREAPLHWHGLWAFGGVCACVAGVAYAALRVARSGIKLNKV